MKQPKHEKSGLDAKSPNRSIETADPALSKEKDHMNSMRHSSAMPGRPELDKSERLREVRPEWFDIHDRAVSLLRSAEPVASELYQLGYRAGVNDERRQAGAVAEAAAARFLDYLAGDPEATPCPLPPLANDWRAAA